MRKRIYIETTIPSFYYTRRQDVLSQARSNWTRQWWAECAKNNSLVSSAAVIAELSRGRSDMIEDRISLLDSVELLPITEEVEEIAQIYIEKMVMPKGSAGRCVTFGNSLVPSGRCVADLELFAPCECE